MVAWLRIRYDRLDADELGFQLRFSIIMEEGDDLFQVAVEFVERLGLAVSAAKAGDIPDVHAGIRISHNDCGIRLHRSKETERGIIVPAG